jgi:hypothetical protein
MRPRGEDGLLLPMAHKRVNMAPYQEAALFALAEDPRACALTVTRKLAIIDKAVGHVLDGDKTPKWAYGRDSSRPGDTFMLDMWTIAVRACRQVKTRGPQHV